MTIKLGEKIENFEEKELLWMNVYLSVFFVYIALFIHVFLYFLFFVSSYKLIILVAQWNIHTCY